MRHRLDNCEWEHGSLRLEYLPMIKSVMGPADRDGAISQCFAVRGVHTVPRGLTQLTPINLGK